MLLIISVLYINYRERYSFLSYVAELLPKYGIVVARQLTESYKSVRVKVKAKEYLVGGHAGT